MPTELLLGLQQGIGALALALAEQGPPVLAGPCWRGPEAVERHGDGVGCSPPYGECPPGFESKLASVLTTESMTEVVPELMTELMTELAEEQALRLGWLRRLS
jgi:hypothetical protein